METALKKAVDKMGGAKKVAAELGVSKAAIYYWISGQRQPSDKLLKYIGLERKISYVRANGASEK